MDDNKYQLKYLPIFYEYMAEVVDCISIDLQNPTAIMQLIKKIQNCIIH